MIEHRAGDAHHVVRVEGALSRAAPVVISRLWTVTVPDFRPAVAVEAFKPTVVVFEPGMSMAKALYRPETVDVAEPSVRTS